MAFLVALTKETDMYNKEEPQADSHGWVGDSESILR